MNLRATLLLGTEVVVRCYDCAVPSTHDLMGRDRWDIVMRGKNAIDLCPDCLARCRRTKTNESTLRAAPVGAIHREGD
jgi:hypothetical protein